MIKAYFVSDIHIKDPEESNSEKLLLFLHQLENNEDSASHLFLVGDIFDLWIHDHTYFVDKYVKIVNAIRSVVAKGIEVHYFEGNHDLYLKKFWQQDVGVRVHDGPVFFNLGSHVVRVEHGDFMNPDDKGYLFLRKFLRSTTMTLLAKSLPGVIVQNIGDRASRASRHYTSHQKKMHEEKVMEFMHTYAESEVQKRFFDFLITGHTHVRDEYKFSHNGEEVMSINLGSWFDDQKALCITEEGYSFIDIESKDY
ncbi:MAG: UDP-2,3-diacylglucosamine diphosphatase [Bdellovibrionales bacterium]|nr:UDP-2,3-diacylglucosamine diphosphatase [Bdellovibrionales bacterium]NQZ20022.1 UDP-2,3-diacylglucosamine diphosphatase [Bdellovibrionales bacterium]